jgi:S-adenosylmethionine-diacylgycerolhomoserine-N-methlytransferase
LVQGDATRPELGTLLPEHGFDRVFISFSLSMIPDWQQVLAAAKNILARSGEVHIVDFGDCQGLPSGFAGLLSAWLARFHVSIRSDLPEVIERQDRSPDWSAHGRHLFRRYSYYGVIARSH